MSRFENKDRFANLHSKRKPLKLNDMFANGKPLKLEDIKAKMKELHMQGYKKYEICSSLNIEISDQTFNRWLKSTDGYSTPTSQTKNRSLNRFVDKNRAW